MALATFALFFHDYSQVTDSPFIVPVAGCLMILGIVVANAWSGIRNREVQSNERLAAIAKGVPIPPTPQELAILHGKPTADLTRRRANSRLAGIILVCSSIGLMAFFAVLAAILQERDVLSGLAVGLIPLGIGAGFLIDVRIQTKEIEESITPSPLA
ncbi:DUF6249 domain-containing protein [Granulicella paludicola]|uniref:DUF6249 domain-containing protein n=1 Tax=Granulicella paludicola TaxID=474951 RepID=UPI0021E0E91A|nr:DUF6249 domain-containing protein [Granulicella paludicola]